MERPSVAPSDVLPYLLREATCAPELWHQKAYLGRVLSVSADDGIRDEGILPVVHALDAMTQDVVVMTIEADGSGDLYPVVYVRRGGRLEEHALPGHPLLDFATRTHVDALQGVLDGFIPGPAARA
jgi:hypothetical protein